MAAEQDPQFDVIVVGGGITGAGTARDAALRGLSCLLLEKEDFGSGVSSRTTRLIHGGLRYLANFEVDLVAESLRERAILRRLAPWLIRPIPLVIPIYKGDPHGRAVISLGIHLYDLLSHERDIPHYSTSGRQETLSREPRLNPEGLTGSALFYDHQILMPERLVLENILSAREAGAMVLNHARVEKIDEADNGVTVTVRDTLKNGTSRYRARTLVNAGGPWIDRIRRAGNLDHGRIISPTKGVHLVLPRLTDQALFIASRDGRMFFIIPFGQHSLIGTTDTRFHDDLDDVHADGSDVDYLLNESRRVLPGLDLSRERILYTYAGVRPLAFSGSSESRISRKHRVIPEGRSGRIITIAGGKLTTYRAMAKDVVDRVCRMVGNRNICETDTQVFPGGLSLDHTQYVAEAVPELAARHRVDPETVRHLIRFYGSRTEHVLALSGREQGLAQQISPASPDIYAQVVYAVREEGARTLQDVVLRRMHLGMTGTRGGDRIAGVANVAARELGWTNEETAFRIDAFRQEIGKDTRCLA